MENIRDRIIAVLSERLQREPDVQAVWLEGADAAGCVDEFSDIDLCCTVGDGLFEEAGVLAQSTLETLGAVDLVTQLAGTDFQRHSVFHLSGTSPFLLIDFVVYRDGHGSQFIFGDEIEKPLVVFDRSGAISYLSAAEAVSRQERPLRLRELRETVAQVSRLEKYLKRGAFLEAYGYYHKWLLQPLIEVLRMKYTPLHPDYYIVHISRHLPQKVLAQLEDLVKFNSIEELELKSKAAIRLFEETASSLAVQ
jgi:hypothetical protein